jgi:hypothetical protein
MSLERSSTLQQSGLHHRKIGTTNIDSKGAVTMPPIIGATIRRITSEPAPVPIMPWTRPAMMIAAVIDWNVSWRVRAATIDWFVNGSADQRQ